MFKIGDFSRIARVSARQLRFYDEIGLLSPGRADPQTGYRYYSAAQLERLNRILVLKELGFSLEEVGRILDKPLGAAELRAMLLLRRADAQRTLEAEALRLRQIETRIGQIENEGRLGEDDVVLRPEPARCFLSIRQILPSFAAAREAIGQVRALAKRCVPASQLGALVVVGHAQEFETDHLDAEIGFILGEEARPDLGKAGGLSLRELEGVSHMAACVRVGLPEDAHLVTTRIGRYIAASGYRLAGPNREYFLQLPTPERMQDSVVEMQYPVEPVPAP